MGGVAYWTYINLDLFASWKIFLFLFGAVGEEAITADNFWDSLYDPKRLFLKSCLTGLLIGGFGYFGLLPFLNTLAIKYLIAKALRILIPEPDMD